MRLLIATHKLKKQDRLTVYSLYMVVSLLMLMVFATIVSLISKPIANAILIYGGLLILIPAGIVLYPAYTEQIRNSTLSLLRKRWVSRLMWRWSARFGDKYRYQKKKALADTSFHERLLHNAIDYDWPDDQDFQNFISTFPVWHQHVFVNLPEQNLSELSENNQARVINSIQFMYGYGWRMDHRHGGVQYLLNTYRNTMKFLGSRLTIREISNLVFPLVEYGYERDVLTNKLCYHLTKDRAFDTCESDMNLILDSQWLLDQTVDLLNFKIPALEGEYGVYGAVAALVWERYLEDDIHGINDQVEKLVPFLGKETHLAPADNNEPDLLSEPVLSTVEESYPILEPEADLPQEVEPELQIEEPPELSVVDMIQQGDASLSKSELQFLAIDYAMTTLPEEYKEKELHQRCLELFPKVPRFKIFFSEKISSFHTTMVNYRKYKRGEFTRGCKNNNKI